MQETISAILAKAQPELAALKTRAAFEAAKARYVGPNGEFTALIAVVMYAIVPAIRYTELGIRSVPVAAVEAARAHGATTWQLLWQVQLPIALPEIMLALNQTIMMALSMVVVAALVGARGLGQAVMTGLTAGAPGLGVAAGLAIAFIAIITDRVIQSWSRRRKAQLGLA